MPSVLVTICARGGSKGVRNKNVRPVAGEPLLGHTIRQASKWDQADEIVVSTDDDQIAETAAEYGARVPFRRPQELASDDAGKLPAIRHATEEVEDIDGRTFDYVVDLDVTAPIRLVEDIENCFDAARDPDALSAFTVTPADKNPYFNMVELDDNGYACRCKDAGAAIRRRQDAPDVYEMNASVYTYDRDYVLSGDSVVTERSKIAEMPRERSVDVDEPMDLAFVTFLMEEWGVDYD